MSDHTSTSPSAGATPSDPIPPAKFEQIPPWPWDEKTRTRSKEIGCSRAFVPPLVAGNEISDIFPITESTHPDSPGFELDFDKNFTSTESKQARSGRFENTSLSGKKQLLIYISGCGESEDRFPYRKRFAYVWGPVQESRQVRRLEGKDGALMTNATQMRAAVEALRLVVDCRDQQVYPLCYFDMKQYDTIVLAYSGDHSIHQIARSHPYTQVQNIGEREDPVGSIRGLLADCISTLKIVDVEVRFWQIDASVNEAERFAVARLQLIKSMGEEEVEEMEMEMGLTMGAEEALEMQLEMQAAEADMQIKMEAEKALPKKTRLMSKFHKKLTLKSKD